MDDRFWQELNAYVDGELPPERASAVASAIAGDRTLARQAALLSRAKAGAAASVELPESLAPGNLRRLAAPRAPRFARLAQAAALACLLLAGGLALLWLQASGERAEAPVVAGGGTPAAPAWLEAAVALHARLDDAGAPADALAPGDFPGLLPDLTSAKLNAEPARPLDERALGRGAIVQYRGERGCLVSFIALEEADTALPEALSRTRLDAVLAYRWRVGAIGYLLLAEGMAEARLEGIAETVYEASRRFRPIEPDGRDRLAEARRRSQPCRA